MGRPRKQNREPFWRSDRSCYYVQHGTRHVRLSPDKDEAWRLWHEFMARPPEEKEKPPVSGPDVLAVEILDAYLDWCKNNKAERTYEWALENIQRFAQALPKGLKVSELKPYHLTTAMEPFVHWANNTKHDFISAVKRAFSWAVDEERIEKNPLARVKKPTREAREFAVSPAEYATIIEAIPDPNFRDLIELNWECGARPQEIRKIEARLFDAENSRIVFPPKEAKGKKYYRIMYLTPRAKEIVARLARANTHGPILLNSDGKPWTKDAINCAFCRLQIILGRRIMKANGEDTKRAPSFKEKNFEPDQLAEAKKAYHENLKKRRREINKLAIELGKKYHLGAFRKGFASQALKNGVDTVTLAHILGHRDPSMVSKVYGLVQQDPEHMAASVNKARKVQET